MNKEGSVSIFLIILGLLFVGGYLINEGIVTINLPSTTITTIGLTTTTTVSSEEFCQKKGTETKLSLSEAKEIAFLSECGDRLEDTYICNEITGTWWINLDIEKEGCNPACVINVETKMAEINWRCTGLLPIDILN